jgi:bifunctional UDP-N-acetylglucosamine pyrophosphorylase/glucosamine-1-phosphate N-acetyltransferase
MAGGLGTRMNSDTPKVLHKLLGKPMILHIIYNLLDLGCFIHLENIFVVVGKYKEQIKTEIEKYINIPGITYIDQYEALGTGHAVQSCSSELSNYQNTKTIILSGDVPLFSLKSMRNLLNKLTVARIVITELEEPRGYGRIVLKEDGEFDKIVEHNDCNESELTIKRVNCGIYAFDTSALLKWLPMIQNNNCKKEYYLTDIVEIIKTGENVSIELYEIPHNNQYEIMGVNTQEQLKHLEENFVLKKIDSNNK